MELSKINRKSCGILNGNKTRDLECHAPEGHGLNLFNSNTLKKYSTYLLWYVYIWIGKRTQPV